MKRYIALFLALLLVFSFSLSANAQENEFIVKAEEISANVGDTVSLKFSFQNNPGIALFTLAIEYDEKVLKLKEINGNSLIDGSFYANPDENHLLWMSSKGDSYFEGTVFTAVFEVLENAPVGKSEVSVALSDGDDSFLNYDFDNIIPQIVSGYVEVGKSLSYGDADFDGFINAVDVSILRKILVGTLFADETTSTVCDVNADGVIELKDLVKLKKYVANMDVVLGQTL